MNPAATTTVVWTGTWSDPGKEAEAANSLVDAGADVLTGHVDSPITYTQTAEKRGVYRGAATMPTPASSRPRDGWWARPGTGAP